VLPDAEDAGLDPAELDRLAVIMSQVDDTDLERVDPPDGLWDRIAASIAAEPESNPAGSGTVVEYSINADDIVITVNEDWSKFARENGALALAEIAPERTLWSYFDGDAVRDLWRLLVERVRATEAQAHVPLRCDAPHMRRWFEMTITPEPDNVVRFRSVLIFEEPRPAVALLSEHVARDSGRPAVPICSWCGEGHDGSRWRQIEELVRDLRLFEDLMPSISYGICTACRDLMSAELLVPAKTHHSPT
jgi:hypothetical protein